jgi:hypothetical protein
MAEYREKIKSLRSLAGSWEEDNYKLREERNALIDLYAPPSVRDSGRYTYETIGAFAREYANLHRGKARRKVLAGKLGLK